MISKLLSLTNDVADSTATVQQQFIGLTEKVSSMSTDDLISWGITNATSLVLKVVLAGAIYVIGRWLVNRLCDLLTKIFEKRQIEISLSKFIISLVSISLMIIVILTTIGVLGINTTSFLAIFASAGLAVGMALSGTLQNFAGGVLILFLKPFKIGDVIEAQGYTGAVKEITLFSTLLNTPDNKMVILPNGPLANSSINNYSKEANRRVDWIFGVAYGSDINLVRSVVEDVLNSHPLIKKDPAIFIAINALSNSSVDIAVRAWCNSADYWTVFFDINEQIYNRFNKEGIEFPFPQMDVHVDNRNK